MAATVLLVEDSRDLRVVYGTMLRHHGHKVVEAGDAAEAVALALEHRPAVIIVDSLLGDADGWRVVTELAHEPRTATIPVIVLTERGEGVISPQNGSSGAIQLTKPLDPRSLLETVARLIAQATQQNSA